MSGCTSCGSKAGCDHRKGAMLSSVEAAIAALYPTRRWGDPDDTARFGAGVGEADAQAIADELAQELNASTFFRPGGDDEYCNYIYVLCVGREPCLVQVRDGDVPLPSEIDSAAPITEQYLRVCLSEMGRFGAVQQVSLELASDGGDLAIVETPRPGVYDAPLLRRFQRLVAILPAYDITHLDFGEISAPPPGFDPGDYGALYGGEPHVANYLFYPQPSTMRVTTVIGRADPLLN